MTGASITDDREVERNVTALRDFTDLPIVVGFGVKDGSSAKKMSKVSDGVIVGTALVKSIADLNAQNSINKDDVKRCTALIGIIRKELDDGKEANSFFEEHE